MQPDGASDAFAASPSRPHHRRITEMEKTGEEIGEIGFLYTSFPRKNFFENGNRQDGFRPWRGEKMRCFIVAEQLRNKLLIQSRSANLL